VCSLLTGNAQAQSRMFVSLDNNSIVSYDISLSTPADVEASKVIFSSTNLNNPSGIAFDSAGVIRFLNGQVLFRVVRVGMFRGRHRFG
jgi:hypothetical protein